jgi:DNA-binding transcriptional MerR regulator
MQEGLIKIGKLAKSAGVSISTIHYYVKEGLLNSPTKTSRNMAYYDPQAASEISFIQELQSKRFMPLSTIKLIMQARREGQEMDHVVEMQSLMENIYRPLENEGKQGEISLEELASISKLPRATLKKLESMGFISPAKNRQGNNYDEIDVRIASIFIKLAELGITLDDLEIYRKYIKLIRTETKTMHETFHRLPNQDKVPVMEFAKLLNDLKKNLALKIYRQEAELFGEHIV